MVIDSPITLDSVPSLKCTMGTSSHISPETIHQKSSDEEENEPFPLMVDDLLLGKDEEEPCHLSEKTKEVSSSEENDNQPVHIPPQEGSPLASNNMSSVASIFPGTEPKLLTVLETLEWPSLLAKTKDWVWDSTRGGLLCPNGIPLPLVRVVNYPSTNRWNLSFIASLKACKQCKIKKCCTTSEAPTFRKEYFTPQIPSETAKVIQELLKKKERPKCRLPKQKIRRPELPIAKKMLRSWRKAFNQNNVGIYDVCSAILLPAEVRKIFPKSCANLETHVKVILPLEIKKSAPIFAATPAERQHRRLNWLQRNQWNELPAGTQVHLSFAGSVPLSHLH